MRAGFAVEHLDLLRCPADSGKLVADRSPGDETVRIAHGQVACMTCERRWNIDDGVLVLLDPDRLDEESLHEQRKRDLEALSVGGTAVSPAEAVESFLEVPPTLAWAVPEPGGRILEMGCGSGRYTRHLAARAGAVLAIDFSRNALQSAAENLPEGAPVSFVQADATAMAVAPGGFDTVVSTLVSNLPTARHREAMLRIAARALNPAGRFVFSTHYYGLRARMVGLRREGRYDEGGMYRRFFSATEIARETRRVFRDVRTRPISVVLPLSRRLGLPLAPISRVATHIPLLRQWGSLLLVRARSARRELP